MRLERWHVRGLALRRARTRRMGGHGSSWRLLASVPLLAILAGLVSASPNAQAAGRAALVIDANTGQDLHVRDADRPLYPASLTKMMTLYLTFERIEQKRLSYTSRLQVSETCAGKPPSNLDLGGGDTLSVRDAVLALVVKSANDVACVVAETLAGSEEKFASLMTARARQIGMRATTFRNASGLPDPGQVTTARDMATLALRLTHDFPEHYKLFSAREFTFNGHTHRSHNSLLLHFEGTDGIKTGYTRLSGFNLVSSVRRGQKHVIGVVFGGVTAAQRNAHMRAIVTQALGRAKAMSSPTLVRRPSLVTEPMAALAKSPVPRRVAAGPGVPAPDPSTPAVAAAGEPVRAGGPRLAYPAAFERQTPQRPALPAVARTAPAHAAWTATVATADPQPNPVTPPHSVRRPGTLQDQAYGRDESSPPPRVPPVASSPSVTTSRARLTGPGAMPVAGGTGGPFHVQIGAFSNVNEAQRQLSSVSGRAGAVLAGHPPVTVPFSKDNLQFYRARFAGFNEAKAQAACQSLKQHKIECVVMRAE